VSKAYNPIIGKDVIESLTTGMYEDSKFIFREYIQNSADQIDKAVKEGLIGKNEGEIHIKIDPVRKKIIFEDNATGIPEKEVQPILQNIAQSTKTRGIDKGFRGIGRLGGLAYSSKLIFETSFKGENTKSTLVWDSLLLKNIINNRDSKENAVEVIRKVTTYEVASEEIDAHYFKVELEGVTNEDLLDKKGIAVYLSMIAPIPFSTKFIFKAKIYDELKKEKIHLDEYNIYLNTEQLFKNYSTYLHGTEGKSIEDQIIDVQFFKTNDQFGNLLYWGWYSISEKNHNIKKFNTARGFRLRKSNIQIGDEYTLLKLHRDKRFNFYFFGEIYGIHPSLLPNSRRDYFVENDTYFEFESKLKNFFYTTIYNFCYTASKINSSIKTIKQLDSFQEELEEKQKIGFIDTKEHEEYKEKFVRKQEAAKKAKNKIKQIQETANESGDKTIEKIINRIVKPELSNEIAIASEPKLSLVDAKPKLRTDNLSHLNKDKRKFLGKIFSIIRDVLDEETGEVLIQKIEEEI